VPERAWGFESPRPHQPHPGIDFDELVRTGRQQLTLTPRAAPDEQDCSHPPASVVLDLGAALPQVLRSWLEGSTNSAATLDALRTLEVALDPDTILPLPPRDDR
jgi:hypothetical protein